VANRDQTYVYLALGSNLGDRRENLHKALKELSAQVSIKKISSIYETPPWGYVDQPVFYNMVICGYTLLNPVQLLDFVKTIEHEMGRINTFRNGPRVIDIDILLFGEQKVNLENLEIPHPRMLERGFVLQPLAEIEPNLVIPGTKTRVLDFLQKIDQTGIQKLDSEKNN
jgi:2-amino-4-hydroxy-6-hydroxymethyldihydropteridine diphosphokinase